MKEKLQEYALLAEIVGGVGIIASLIFVGIQLQQSSDAVKAQTRSQISIAYSQMIQSQRQDQGYISTTIKLRNNESLDEIERLRWELNMGSIMRLAENSFYQYRNGNYSEREFEGERDFWKQYFSSPYNLEVWSKLKNGFSPDFREDIDKLIEEY
jgi:hypothetical protein